MNSENEMLFHFCKPIKRLRVGSKHFIDFLTLARNLSLLSVHFVSSNNAWREWMKIYTQTVRRQSFISRGSLSWPFGFSPFVSNFEQWKPIKYYRKLLRNRCTFSHTIWTPNTEWIGPFWRTICSVGVSIFARYSSSMFFNPRWFLVRCDNSPKRKIKWKFMTQ